MSEILSGLSITTNFAIFFMLAFGIWFTGSRLTYIADAVSERYKLASSTVGLVFLALATSLPEVATTLTAAVKQNSELVLNNLFGGVALQTAILAFADFWAKGAISNYPRKANHALEAILLVALMACLQLVIVLNEPVSILGVGAGSIAIALVYVGSIWLLRWYEENSDWVPIDLPEFEKEQQRHNPYYAIMKLPDSRLLFLAIGACILILILGTAIIETSETLARQTGFGSSFFGVTFLAAATSLPELSTTITAVRMGAYTLAISNIFGSNLIMIVLVFPADVLHTSGPILKTSGSTAQLAIATGTIVTTVFLTGLIIRRKPKLGPIGVDSFVVLFVYALSIVLYYGLI